MPYNTRTCTYFAYILLASSSMHTTRTRVVVVHTCCYYELVLEVLLISFTLTSSFGISSELDVSRFALLPPRSENPGSCKT